MLLVPSIGWGAGSIDYLHMINYVEVSGWPYITAMVNISPGDLLIYIQRESDNDPPVPTEAYPAGWTPIGTSYVDGGGGNVRMRCCASYKIAIGNEDSTNITGMAEDQASHRHILQFRANKALTSLEVDGLVWTATTGGGNPNPQTIAASGAVGPALGVAIFMAGDQGVDPRTSSVTPDHEFSVSGATWIQTYYQQKNPQNYTFDMSGEANVNMLMGFYLHNFRGSSIDGPTGLMHIATWNEENTQSGSAIPIPSATQVGDLLIFENYGADQYEEIMPYHFIKIVTTIWGGNYNTLSAGLCTTGIFNDGYLYGYGSSSYASGTVMTFRTIDNPIRRVAVGEGQGQYAYYTAPTNQSFGSGVKTPWVAAGAWASEDALTGYYSMSPAGLYSEFDNGHQMTGYKIYNSSGATTTVSATYNYSEWIYMASGWVSVGNYIAPEGGGQDP